MRNPPTDVTIAAVLEAVEQGEIGLTQARAQLRLSLEELAVLLSEHDIDPPYSSEDYEQDQRVIRRAV